MVLSKGSLFGTWYRDWRRDPERESCVKMDYGPKPCFVFTVANESWSRAGIRLTGSVALRIESNICGKRGESPHPQNASPGLNRQL